MQRLVERLNQLGCSATVEEDGRIEIDTGSVKACTTPDADWVKAIQDFYKARQYAYDSERQVLASNRAAEFRVFRLDVGFYYRETQEFTDTRGNAVHLAAASKEYRLAYFESDRYAKAFARIRERIERRANRPGIRRRSPPTFRFEDLFINFHTVTYTAVRKPRGKKITDVAIKPVKSCLFALAYRKGESWELSNEVKAKGIRYLRVNDDLDTVMDIPRASYDAAAVTFYKVAKSSQFPSQIFLAYYHILELHFLKVADADLYNAVCAQLNNPDFESTYANVSKLLAVIKRHDSTSDEREMLRGVLRKYVVEEEFIEFVSDFESNAGEAIYTDQKTKVFGERFSIKLEKGHAISNAATIIKHIRNALVHSSDRYAREDCFLPLSESQDDVVKFIPIVQFMAERVIFATAESGL